jgi:hypothetical protein
MSHLSRLKSGEHRSLKSKNVPPKQNPHAASHLRSHSTAQTFDWSPTSAWAMTGHRFYPILILILAIATAGVFYVRFLASQTHLAVEGSRLRYRFFEYSTYRYLVNFHSEIAIWAARNNQLDARLESHTSEDTGLLTLSTLSANAQRQTLLIEPSEWFGTRKSGQDQTSAPLTPDDPSLSPGTVLMDNGGNVLKRDDVAASRLGKSLPFLTPRWPKELHRKGDSWTETIEWTDQIDLWKIRWQGELQWTLTRYEACSQSKCARLKYEAHLTPTLMDTPAWARSVVSSINFNGDAFGTALFDMQQNQLVSNSFSYRGALSIALLDLARIPAYKHAPGPRIHEPGAVVVQLTNKININKP